MKYGICEWSLPVSSTLAMQIAKEIGYDGMQIGEAGGRLMGYPLNNRRVQELYLEKSQECALELHSLNLGALLAEESLNYAFSCEKGKHAREILKKGFEVCERLDIGTVVITVNSQNEEQTKNVLEHLKYAAELSKESGVKIAMESAQELSTILSILERSEGNIKICMDLLNPLRFGTGEPQEQIEVFGKDRISHFHMKDSRQELFVPGERGCTLLGEGDAGFSKSVDLILESAYDGWLITENYYYLPPMNNGEADFAKLAAADLMTMKKRFE